MTDKILQNYILPSEFEAAKKCADSVLPGFWSRKKDYTVYCPDDFCSEIELNGIGKEGDYGYHIKVTETALDMTICAIHQLTKTNGEYSCREEAVLSSIVLLYEYEKANRGNANGQKAQKLFKELCRLWHDYIADNKGLLQAAENCLKQKYE